jgi:PTH1 family peptidyl-tRNA hydrolase
VKLILGLGNPGPEYDGTRHNVGFGVVDELARRWGPVSFRQRHRALHAQVRLGPAPVLLAKPLTYMNLSGEAARPLLRYHGLDTDDLVVVHDEADLPPGEVRVKCGGGIAGHKGLVSLVQQLGTPEFLRVRVGIGRPQAGGGELVRHVLARPAPEEAGWIADGVERAADAVEAVVQRGTSAAMNEFNRGRSTG